MGKGAWALMHLPFLSSETVCRQQHVEKMVGRGPMTLIHMHGSNGLGWHGPN